MKIKKKPLITLKTAAIEKDIPFTPKDIESIEIEKHKLSNGPSCESIAYFGVAMYHAQMTEEVIRQLIAFACDKNKQSWPKDIKTMSMGRLFDWLKKNLPKDYQQIGEKRINKAVQIRNYMPYSLKALTV